MKAIVGHRPGNRIGDATMMTKRIIHFATCAAYAVSLLSPGPFTVPTVELPVRFLYEAIFSTGRPIKPLPSMIQANKYIIHVFSFEHNDSLMCLTWLRFRLVCSGYAINA